MTRPISSATTSTPTTASTQPVQTRPQTRAASRAEQAAQAEQTALRDRVLKVHAETIKAVAGFAQIHTGGGNTTYLVIGPGKVQAQG